MLLQLEPSPRRSAVDDLFADRFFNSANRGSAGAAARWRDLATGRPVRMRVMPAGPRDAQLVWSDTCASVARLRHPGFNDLLDYGALGREQLFEAYDASATEQVAAVMPQRVLAHAAAFLDVQAPQLDRAARGCLLRRAVPSTGRPRGVAIGVVVQNRLAFAAIEDVLADAPHVGIASIAITGPRGSGVRTTALFAARSARLAGYIPVASHLLRDYPWLWDRVIDRHLCVIAAEPHTSRDRADLAMVVTRLGGAGARRHVIVHVGWTERESTGAIEVDPMSADALCRMLFLDHGRGPDRRAIRAAARDAAGWPGIFLDLLGARFGSDRAPTVMTHESSPAYVVAPKGHRGIGRILKDAPERATRLARRGRHACAIRLLTRASRVLEGRGERRLAGACTNTLGWIERARGRSTEALAAFIRARELGGEGNLGVRGAIGAGVVLTDQRGFDEAEAALRAACAASTILVDTDLDVRARRALARCLYWQGRFDEASLALSKPRVGGVTSDALVAGDANVEDDAMRARIATAQGDLRSAMASAARALEQAEPTGDDRLLAIAARSMASAQAAVGNAEQAHRWITRALEAARRAHLPLVTLRLRALELGMTHPAGGAANSATRCLRAALRRPGLPALIRAEIDRGSRGPASVVERPCAVADRTLRDLETFLSLVHSATDDVSGLEALCLELAGAIRAATVQIVTGSSSPRTLARAGRPWQGESAVVDSVLAGAREPSADTMVRSRCAAEAIRFSREAIAVLCCRWSAGTTIDPPITVARLKAAALAAAPAVRAMLDRAQVAVVDSAGGELIGTSPAAQSLRESMARAARAPFPVLIEGESGSGKELVARGIHRLGSRRDRRLCAVNCAALTDDLLEAELFGHARGAFTGAVGERPGLFEEADGGTLFLDEVGELSARAQAKLLRVLQDGEVRRVGENLARRVDARIVAATNRRLDEEVTANRFRGDLRFRLDVVRLSVPPLRDRASDIPALALHFWNDAAGRVGSSATLTSEALAALARYDWPGNIRELQNAIATIAVHAPRRGRIVPSMLPAQIARAARSAATTFEAARADFERRYVRAALAQAAGHRSRAARSLGVSRQGLAKMLRRLGLDGEC